MVCHLFYTERHSNRLTVINPSNFVGSLQDCPLSYMDFIYSDVKYRKDDIDALQETIRKKYDIMMEKKQKQQNQKRRK